LLAQYHASRREWVQSYESLRKAKDVVESCLKDYPEYLPSYYDTINVTLDLTSAQLRQGEIQAAQSGFLQAKQLFDRFKSSFPLLDVNPLWIHNNLSQIESRLTFLDDHLRQLGEAIENPELMISNYSSHELWNHLQAYHRREQNTHQYRINLDLIKNCSVREPQLKLPLFALYAQEFQRRQHPAERQEQLQICLALIQEMEQIPDLLQNSKDVGYLLDYVARQPEFDGIVQTMTWKMLLVHWYFRFLSKKA
jgi:hypothetical protein